MSHFWSEFEKFKAWPNEIPENVQKEIGTADQLGSITLSQFTLAKKRGNEVEQYYAMPMDVVKEKRREEEGTYLLNPIKFPEKRMVTDLPEGLGNVWLYSEVPLETIQGFLPSYEMGKYLLGEVPSEWKRLDDLFNIEDRTGIRKNRSIRSAKTGGLYSVEYFRLKGNVGFAIEVENTSLLPSFGILRLGGDSRSARYSLSSWAELPVDQIKKKISEDKRFKIVLETPAIFNKGWLPAWINRDTMEGGFEGANFRLVSACVGKAIGIGGYNFVKNTPKVMKKAVPAGSVYYFELIDGSIDNLFERFWLKSVGDERSQEGFGITLIGGFNYV
jgi:CRISPR-associated protein Cmr3